MPQRSSASINWRLRGQKYRLVGGRCKKCMIVNFPARSRCPECDSETEQHMLSGNGEIVSFTRIHTAPQGFEAPYTIGLVRLEEGPVISGHIIGNAEIGKKVRLVLRKLFEDGDSGLKHYGFKFEVSE